MEKNEILFKSFQIFLSKKIDSDNHEVIYSEDDVVFCDLCDKLFEPNSNCSHLKALSCEEFDRFKHIKLTIKNPDIKEFKGRID